MASRPVLLTVDDDPAVSRAVARDLRRRYGDAHRIVRAESGPSALDAVRELALRGEPVALLLADHRMPGMTGVEFLEQAMDLVPQARRVLLTAYADTEAAIRAINVVDLDHYLLKPWDPPEERLYPVLDDLLEQWRATAAPRATGLRVVGHRWSARSHDVRELLSRRQVPYRWYDASGLNGEGSAGVDAPPPDAEAARLLSAAGPRARLPLLVLEDGQVLADPSNLDIAAALGLATRAELPYYDVAVVGGGPAGLGAAVYAASEGLRAVIVESDTPGGQAGQSSRIENYLGFPSGLSGADLARRAVAQAGRFGAELLSVTEVTALEAGDGSHLLRLSNGDVLAAGAVLIASGVSYRRLPVVDAFTGRGVYYGAAMSEGPACADQDVHVIGGANSAGQAAVYFAGYARSVTVVVRADTLEKSMSHYLVDRLAGLANVQVRTCTEVVGAHGDDHLTALDLLHTATGRTETVPTGGCFVFIGAAPRTEWLGDTVRRDPRGFVLAGADLVRDGRRPAGWPLDRDPYYLETSAPGVFVAGDVRSGSVKRVASAVGEGAMAVTMIHRYLERS